jgi:hypothetical protein
VLSLEWDAYAKAGPGIEEARIGAEEWEGSWEGMLGSTIHLS